MAKKQPEVVQCSNCGGGRNHDILRTLEESWDDDELGERGYRTYAIARCCGCDTTRFVMKSWDTSLYYAGPDGSREIVRIYPDDTSETKRPAVFEEFELPDKVDQMYHETLRAFGVGAYTLCGAGLRAVVEALCLDLGVKGRKLWDKIEALVADGHLARNQADHLHEERYLGNAAVHEMEAPSQRDLEDGLQIIEGLLKTIYVLPRHAASMEKRRKAREAKKAAAAPATASSAKTASSSVPATSAPVPLKAAPAVSAKSAPSKTAPTTSKKKPKG